MSLAPGPIWAYVRPAPQGTALTLRSKLLLMFVLFALIPLMVIGALGYVESLRALEALIGSQTSLIAERIATEVRDRRERLDANSALLAENVETARVFAAHASGSPESERAAIAAARPYLMEVRAAIGSDVEWISFRDGDGRELFRLSDSLQAETRDDDDRVVQLSRALPDHAGTIAVGVPLPALLPPEALEARFGRAGYVVVIDRATGRALHDPEHADALTLARDGSRARSPVRRAHQARMSRDFATATRRAWPRSCRSPRRSGPCSSQARWTSSPRHSCGCGRPRSRSLRSSGSSPPSDFCSCSGVPPHRSGPSPLQPTTWGAATSSPIFPSPRMTRSGDSRARSG